MRRRLTVTAVLASVSFLAGSAGAGPTREPQIKDPANDAVGGQAGHEIVSALWTTTGDTVVKKVRGKKRTFYTPRKLVVTLNLAGAPMGEPFAYETSADFAGCGTVRFTYTPGTVFGQLIGESSLWYDCGDPDPTTGDTLTLVAGVSHKVGAKSMTWEYPIKGFPKVVKPGITVRDFRAAVDVVDPVFGLEGTPTTGTPLDEATGAGMWKLGS